jgi:hypothetical protein
MNVNGIDMQVCIDGKPIREFGSKGRTFVEGRKGLPFTIKLKNHHSYRINAVVRVDGLGVVSGNEDDSKGYILDAYSSYEIKGWRQSLNDVATFVFSGKDGSYAKEVKGSNNQGCIRLIAYEERIVPKPVVTEIHHHHDHYYDTWVSPWIPPWWQRPSPYYPKPIYWMSTDGVSGHSGPTGPCGVPGSNGINMTAHLNMSKSVAANDISADCGDFSASFNSTSLSSNGAEELPKGLNLGTAWGSSQQDNVSETAWENGKLMCDVTLFYTDIKGLKKLGIDTKKPVAVAAQNGFCAPPKQLIAR